MTYSDGQLASLTCTDCGRPRKKGNRRCNTCRWKSYYDADPERARSRQRERSRRFRAENPEGARAGDRRVRHGREIAADYDALWASQDGRCYLCGDDLVPGSTHIDHDHSCCPTNRSCRACRRGLTCARCNKTIGMVGDDAELLLRIAASLQRADLVVKARIASRSQQLALAVEC